ncbi:cytokinin riboside 5'-monophosphate phosphoribohydrolase [Kordiimonas sediminis]|uniref:Cytokinin riboside 5'-monophosphate phosphoribohydrolase n=1 Tax=Kordiimonas sediminis TaxID=1735581 RepID=A0A919AWP5_9PROT|nr:TIGR00730 family Rossman fold protein [Kordiimonas sediminis]GHF27141.1 cytokinin riboside 5'-monophosphate phosphoribohydrolase [Kordiimonas sediminis]
MSVAKIKNICVYCGSRVGTSEVYADAAKALGSGMGERQQNLVYGAGSIGLMGIIARAVTASGGDVYGIIPDHLDAVEITQSGLAETVITENMHERKKLMFDKSDAFIVLPGGLGTLDETFEIITWAQLSLHSKPIIILNIDEYWTPFLTLVESVIEKGFANPSVRDLFKVTTTVEETFDLLDCLARSDDKTKSHLF